MMVSNRRVIKSALNAEWFQRNHPTSRGLDEQWFIPLRSIQGKRSKKNQSQRLILIASTARKHIKWFQKGNAALFCSDSNTQNEKRTTQDFEVIENYFITCCMYAKEVMGKRWSCLRLEGCKLLSELSLQTSTESWTRSSLWKVACTANAWKRKGRWFQIWCNPQPNKLKSGS